jgi:hypothetical protein
MYKNGCLPVREKWAKTAELCQDFADETRPDILN